MEWFSVAWEWLGVEIVDFGFRWLVVLMIGLIFGGFVGKRYRSMTARVAALEERQHQAPQVIYNVYAGTAPVADDAARILMMSQAEYDALPEKDPRTLYLIGEDSTR